MTRPSIAIVGASLCGLRAAEELRRGGYAGRLVMVGDEPHRPYDRPPLSKELAAGQWQPEQTRLEYDEAALDAEWRLGNAAAHLNVEALEITFADGSKERFEDGIVIATGARARSLPQSGLKGMHVVRTLDDSIRLQADLAARPKRVAVVGGGFIGAEVASVCRRLDLDVTLLEALSAPMERVLGPEIGSQMATLLGAHGVDLRLGTTVLDVEEDGGRVSRLRLSDGSVLDVDVVVVGIGVDPCTDWLRDSGLMIDNGVVCDETCSVAYRIVAAGDVARWPNRRFNEIRRVEHWDNAIRQGQHAARRLLADHGIGTPEAYEPLPWFWSDQFGAKLQLVGSTMAYDRIEILGGSAASGDLLALYRAQGAFVGAFAVNRKRDILAARGLLTKRASWDEAIAALSPSASNVTNTSPKGVSL